MSLLEEECLAIDAWPAGLVRSGVTGETPTVSFWVAETAQGVVGYAAASVAADLAELQRIAVGPEQRRRGLAGLLLGAVVTHARSGGADRLLLEVREDNDAARAFYRRHGFTEIDRRRRYYRDGATAVVMLLPLD